MAFAFAIAVPSAHAAGGAQVGAKLYQQNCAKCHGPNGKGDGPELARIHAAVTPNDWTDKESKAEMPDKAIISMVTKGGQANGKSKLMPSFREKLDDAQIQDLIAYIRTLPQ
ncbi:MAG: c-type cytochrome [Candidatus Binataceae bacterium]